jgi:hypothetical protein
MTPLDQLNSCKYLYMEDLQLNADLWSLVVTATEARLEDQEVQIQTGSPEVNEILGSGRRIVANGECSRFRLTFGDYLSFAVTDESFALPEESEDYSKKLRTYTSSSFLDYIGKSTRATQEHPGPFTHYALVCSDHIINVVCEAPPVVELVSTGST